jgi:hypothetical protein
LIFNKHVTIQLCAASQEDFNDWTQHIEEYSTFPKESDSEKLTSSESNSLSGMNNGDKSNVAFKSTDTVFSIGKNNQEKVTISDFEILRVLGQGQYGKVSMICKDDVGVSLQSKVYWSSLRY